MPKIVKNGLETEVETKVESFEEKAKRAEENLISFFHKARVDQHNEAVDAIKKNNDESIPDKVTNVKDLPAYDPDQLAQERQGGTPAPVVTFAQEHVAPEDTPGAPENKGATPITIVDPDEETPDVTVDPVVAPVK